MKVKYEIVYRSKTYREPVDQITSLIQKDSEKEKGNINVADDIQTHCIVGQMFKPNLVQEVDEDKIGALPNAKKMKDAKANDA